ncbi:MAG: hypothetical protein ACOC2W_03840 [bacterium]
MVKKYFLVRVGKNVEKSLLTSLHSQCWIPILNKFYDSPDEAQIDRDGYDDPENFIILSCYEKE